MRQLMLTLVLAACVVMFIPQKMLAARAVVISAKCEVVSVVDDRNLMRGQVMIGDEFDVEIWTLPQSFMPFSTSVRPTMLFDVRMWNQNVEIDFAAGSPSISGQGVNERERANGQCRNELWMALVNIVSTNESAPFALPTFIIDWGNNECYGDDEFEQPQDLDIDDWEMQTIDFSTRVGLFQPDEIGFTATVLEYEVTEFQGGVVNVRAFEDRNLNCRYDPGEETVTPLALEVNDDPNVTVSVDADGIGYLQTRKDKVALSLAAHTKDWKLSCGQSSIEYEFTEGATEVINIPLERVQSQEALKAVLIGADATRPGTVMQYRVFVSNPTTAELNGQLRFEYDNVLSLNGAKPAADNTGGSSIVWDLESLAPGARTIFLVDMHLTNDPLLQGDDLCARATLVSESGEEIETIEFCQTIVGHLDQILLSRLKRERDTQESTVEAGEDVAFVLHVNNRESRSVKSLRVLVPYNNDFVGGVLKPEIASHAYRSLQLADGSIEYVFEGVNLDPAGDGAVGGSAFMHLAGQMRQGLNSGRYIENYVQVVFEYEAEPGQELPSATRLLSNVVTSRVGAVVSSVDSQDAAKVALRVFPNPSSERLNIEHPNLGGAIVHVHDQLGRRVAHFHSAGASLRIDTDAFAVGLYVLRIEFKSGGLETVRFGVVR